MTARYHPNLAARPFRRFRLVNLALAAALLSIVGFGVWQGVGFARYSAGILDLQAREQAARVEWESLGMRVEELEARLERPDAVAAMEEIRFLNTILARKQFSWTRLLGEIEQTVPRTVYIVSLEPSFSESGEIELQMEARGENVEALSRFLTNLGDHPSFGNVTVTVEETGEVQGRVERRILTQAEYHPSETVPEVAGR